ncbi:hypothetical protein [Jiulongibacter sp. NS-SX5]|uniref:hypothetical protein n=1 Tax=Jiulongibacter sp. NS-SX5 TaxID=3463854 RepID=UPI004059EAC1
MNKLALLIFTSLLFNLTSYAQENSNREKHQDLLKMDADAIIFVDAAESEQVLKAKIDFLKSLIPENNITYKIENGLITYFEFKSHQVSCSSDKFQKFYVTIKGDRNLNCGIMDRL